MSCDPLASASLGIFTCNADNCNPCTIASLGLFTFGGADDDSGGGGRKSYEKHVNAVHQKYLDALDDFNISATALRNVRTESSVVEIESEKFLTPKPPPVALTAPPIKDITSDIDRELARVMRLQAIQAQMQEIIQEINEQTEFDEMVLLILLANEV